jgi:hypothetical protein
VTQEGSKAEAKVFRAEAPASSEVEPPRGQEKDPYGTKRAANGPAAKAQEAKTVERYP